MVESVQKHATKLIDTLKDKPYEDRLIALDLSSMTYRRKRATVNILAECAPPPPHRGGGGGKKRAFSKNREETSFFRENGLYSVYLKILGKQSKNQFS